MRRFVIATTLLICLLLAPGALARAPHSFYGVISANDPDASEIARMGAGKVGTLRVNFVWGAVQPAPGAPLNWSHYDAIVGPAAQNGIRVLPTIYSSPAWAAAQTNYPPARQYMDDFGAFVHAAALRYGKKGGFWAEHPEIPRMPITHWQLWNEVNTPNFWYPKPRAKQYVSLLRVTHDKIKSADPSAKILLSGLFMKPNGRNGVRLVKYLPGIYRAGGKRLFDAVSVHPYAGTPRKALRDLLLTREIMSHFHDGRKQLWITEIGWATGGVSITGGASTVAVTPSRQATYLRKTYKLLAANRKRLHLAGVVWYSWRDGPGGFWVEHTGLFTSDLSPKPAWYAFVSLTGGTP
ncbi:MAG TPA: hypothetical protein VGJ61_03050 [Solirubrobacterales bacterium]